MKETRYIVFNNEYTCGSCGTEWSDTWGASCDDDCPKCGETTSPDETGNFEYVTEDELPRGLKPEDCMTVGDNDEWIPAASEATHS